MSRTLDLRIPSEAATLRLFADRALFWVEGSVLCLSDVHLGKAETLQTFGLPIPSGDHSRDLLRIAALLRETKAQRLFVLGDLIHKKRGLTGQIQEDLRKFLAFFSQVEVTLLLGNHERGSRSILSSFAMRLLEEDLAEGPFRFLHGHDEGENFGGFSESGKPAPPGTWTIQGHLHPMIRLSEGSTSVRLPCFWMEHQRITLPSFGSLTGGVEIRPQRRDRVFAIAGQEVFEVP